MDSLKVLEINETVELIMSPFVLTSDHLKMERSRAERVKFDRILNESSKYEEEIISTCQDCIPRQIE